jgi:formyl-CoA transferase
MTSITSFGQRGPRRDSGGDLVASALGGALHVTGEADDPPVRLDGRQACVTASLVAAAGTLIALRHAARTGRGQRVDVSLLEAVVSATHICGIGKWHDDGIVPRRNGTGLFASVPSGTYRCRDGLAYLMVNRPRHWQALAAWIREVTGMDGACDPLFEGPSSRRIPYRDLIDTYVGELTSRFTVDEVYHEGQRRHLAFTPVQTAAEVVRDVHLAARGFFVAVDQRDGAGSPCRARPIGSRRRRGRCVAAHRGSTRMPRRSPPRTARVVPSPHRGRASRPPGRGSPGRRRPTPVRSAGSACSSSRSQWPARGSGASWPPAARR